MCFAVSVIKLRVDKGNFVNNKSLERNLDLYFDNYRLLNGHIETSTEVCSGNVLLEIVFQYKPHSYQNHSSKGIQKSSNSSKSDIHLHNTVADVFG